ncbi:MAG: hypothetical protein U0236_21145 [Nitrospira sp.]
MVDRGNVATAGGVAPSVDLDLDVVERLAGPAARARIAPPMDHLYFQTKRLLG